MIVTANPSFWQDGRAAALLQRLGPAPREVLDYVAMVNEALGLRERPEALVVPDAFLADVREAIAEMPLEVRQLLEHELLGVFFAQGLGSSAITDVIVAPDGSILGSVVALDYDAFAARSANEWASWKENTPFAQNDGTTLEARIAAPAHDNRKNAIQYLLLHEFGHVLTTGRDFVPMWWIDPQTMLAGPSYAFLRMGWEIDEEKKIVPLPQQDFALRSQVVYYHGARLGSDAIAPVYQSLLRTDFATLYATVNVYDDFAESFASYVHAVLLKRPAEIRILRDGAPLLTVPPYWDSARSLPRRRFLEQFLGLDQPA